MPDSGKFNVAALFVQKPPDRDPRPLHIAQQLQCTQLVSVAVVRRRVMLDFRQAIDPLLKVRQHGLGNTSMALGRQRHSWVSFQEEQLFGTTPTY